MSKKHGKYTFIIGLLLSFGSGVLFFFLWQKKTVSAPLLVQPIQGYPARTKGVGETKTNYQVYDNFVEKKGSEQKEDMHLSPPEEIPELKPEDFECSDSKEQPTLNKTSSFDQDPQGASPLAEKKIMNTEKIENAKIDNQKIEKPKVDTPKKELSAQKKCGQDALNEGEDLENIPVKKEALKNSALIKPLNTEKSHLPESVRSVKIPQEEKPQAKKAQLALQIGGLYSSFAQVRSVIQKLPPLPSGAKLTTQKRGKDSVYRLLIQGFANAEIMNQYKRKMEKK